MTYPVKVKTLEQLTSIGKQALRNQQRSHLATATTLRMAGAAQTQINEELYQARAIGLRLDGWYGPVPR